MEHREDRRGGADSDREGQDGREGEPWRVPERPEGKPEILEHAATRTPSVCHAVPTREVS